MCGLYGWLEPGGVSHNAGRTVKGVFVAFGRVVVHGRGLRAEKGRIVALIDDSDKAREVGSLYELRLVPDDEALKEEAERWGEVREPTEALVNDALWAGQITAAKLVGETITAKRIVSGYRTPQQQANLANHPGTSNHGVGSHLGRPTRVVAILELMPPAEVVQYQHPGGGVRVRVKNLDPCWTIRNIIEEVERIEAPLPGSQQVPAFPGRRSFKLEIEGDFPGYIEGDRALRALLSIGRISQISQAPIV
jgi:hypothetical protein